MEEEEEEDMQKPTELENTIIWFPKAAKEARKELIEFAFANGFSFMISEWRDQTDVPASLRPFVVKPSVVLAALGVKHEPLPEKMLQSKAAGPAQQHNDGQWWYYSPAGPGLRLERLYGEHIQTVWKSQQYQFLLAIEKIFEDGDVIDYCEDTATKTIRFDLRNVDVKFEQLAALSDLLGTRKINVSDSYVNIPGCDTCGHGRKTSTPISCSQVVFA